MTVLLSRKSPFIADPIQAPPLPPTPTALNPPLLLQKPLYRSSKIKVIAVHRLVQPNPLPALAPVLTAAAPPTAPLYFDTALPLKRPALVEEDKKETRPAKRLRRAYLPVGLEWDSLNAESGVCRDCAGMVVVMEADGRAVCTACGLVDQCRIISDAMERCFAKEGGKDDGNPRANFLSSGTEIDLVTFLGDPKSKGGGGAKSSSDPNEALLQSHSSVTKSFRSNSATIRSAAERALHNILTPSGQPVPEALRKKALMHFDHYTLIKPNLANSATLCATLLIMLKFASDDLKDGVTLRSLYEVNEDVKWSDVRKKLKAVEKLRAAESRAAKQQLVADDPLTTTAAPPLKLVSRPPSTPSASVDGFCSRLGVHIKVATFCKFVTDRMSDNSLLIGKRPDSQLAAVLLFAIATLPDAKTACTLQQLSMASGVSAATTHTHFSELYANRRWLLPLKLVVSAAASEDESARVELHNLRCEEYNGPRIDPAAIAALPDKALAKSHFA